ncbi:MAG: DNA primase [Spirochaetaceae bacterium]|nr:DNA primase [Spirochaetaceae bacterium]
MPKISAQTIDEVNAQTDIVTLVGEYVHLQKKGSNYWGCCPFHNEKTPSFAVSADKRIFHCFGCGKGGSVINFYMEIEKASFYDTILALAKRSGIPVIYDGNTSETKEEEQQHQFKKDLLELYKKVAGMFNYFLVSTDMGKQALEYLKSRGVTEQIINEFQLGYSPSDRYWLKKFLHEKNYSDEFLEKSGLFSKNYPNVSFFSDRLMFPICNRNGEVVAFGGRILTDQKPKYLNTGDLPQYKKGETLYAFNLAKEAVRKTESVIFCEGYMDVIAYHQAGISYAVAPLGTALTENQVAIIKPLVKTVYLSFDGDSAGMNATYKAILLCRKADLSVRIIDINSAFSKSNNKPKDPADILLNFGAQALTDVVNSSIFDSDFLLNKLAQMYPVETTEGKTKAALEFFPYIDALQSEIQKESCFELLAQTFGLNLEAVKSDFVNRDAARKRTETGAEKSLNNKQTQQNIKKNAELRAVLAVVSHMDSFPMMRSMLSPDDFEEPLAKELYFILEECFREEAVGYDSILSKCEDERLKKLVTETIVSKEFEINSEKTIEDSINLLKKRSLERKRIRLINKIRLWQGTTLEDFQELQKMQLEKISIDNELEKKDAKE